VTLAAGGSAYLRLSVPVGGRATVTLGAARGTLPATIRATLVAGSGGANAVTTFAPGTTTITADGGAAAAETYTLVLYNADPQPRSGTTVTVVANGVATLLAERSPAYAGPTLARLADGAADLPVTDAPVMERLRAIGARELAGRVEAARAEYAARRGQAAPR
jgi:hypothetical protein